MISIEFSQRIDALAAEIAAKHTRMRALPAEKSRALADEKRLVTLEKEADELPLLIARLEERQRLLGLERDAALTHEALTRVGEIEKEQTAIAGRIAERRTAFLQGVETLLALVKADYPDRYHAEELAAEAQYLHIAFQAPWPQTLTAAALNTTDMNPLTAEFTKHSQLQYAGGRWKELTEALRAEQNRTAQKEAEERRRASSSQMVKTYTPPFTAGPQR